MSVVGAGADIDQAVADVRFLTDTVEKVEYRTTPKVSQMLMSGLLRRRHALWCQYVCFFREAMWPLVLPRTKRISSSASGVGTKPTCGWGRRWSAVGG